MHSLTKGIGEAFKSATQGAINNAPYILSATAIVGVVSTAALAVRATPVALQLLEEAEEEYQEPLEPMDMVKVAWKPYIPAVVVGATTILCIVGSTTISHRRQMALVAAYGMSEKIMQNYEEAVKEVVGEKKARDIRTKADERSVASNPFTKQGAVNKYKEGDQLFFDTLSGRYWWSTRDIIRNAINTSNERLINGMYPFFTLNEVYEHMGLYENEIGDWIGWSTDELIDVDYTSTLTDDNELAAVAISFRGFRIDPRFAPF